MNEQLTQAQHSAAFTIDHLQAALAKASAVEALFLYLLIEAAVKLNQSITAFIAAKESKT